MSYTGIEKVYNEFITEAKKLHAEWNNWIMNFQVHFER